MRSLELSGSNEPCDTRVPPEMIPQILRYWLKEIYYGGGLTVADLDRHIGDDLRENLFPRSVVRTWVHMSGLYESPRTSLRVA